MTNDENTLLYENKIVYKENNNYEVEIKIQIEKMLKHMDNIRSTVVQIYNCTNWTKKPDLLKSIEKICETIDVSKPKTGHKKMYEYCQND